MLRGLKGAGAINPEHSAHCVTAQSHYNRAVIMHLSQEDSLCSPPHSFPHRTMSRGHTPSAGDGPWCQPRSAAARPLTPHLWRSPATQPGLPCPCQPSSHFFHYFLPRAPGHLAGDHSLPGPEDTKYRALTSRLPPGASDTDAV